MQAEASMYHAAAMAKRKLSHRLPRFRSQDEKIQAIIFFFLQIQRTLCRVPDQVVADPSERWSTFTVLCHSYLGT